MGFTISRSNSTKAALQRRSQRRRAANRERTRAAATRMRNDLLPDLITERIPIAHLKTNKRKVRRAGEEHIAQLMKSLQSFGQVCPLLIGADNKVIDGEILLEASKRLGLNEINCTRLEHLAPEEERLLRITLNRTQELGEWDIEILQDELIELETFDLDLTVTGFGSAELDGIMTLELPSETADEAPAPPEEPVSQAGDLWLCGAHKVRCGSALDADMMAELMEGERAAAVVTDPPYNTKIKGQVSGLGKHKHDDFVMASGEMTDAEFADFLERFLAAAAGVCADGAVIFACMDWRQVHLLRMAADASGLFHINTIVWDKGSGAMGGLYRSAYELVCVFCTAKSAAINNVKLGKHGRDRTNVQHYPGANRPGSSAGKALALHATPKPVELIADLILDVTETGGIVLDPFLGSGTALIAAEETNRRVYGTELDPKFVDVTVRRWEEWTGEKAVHAETGLTFTEMAAARAEETKG